MSTRSVDISEKAAFTTLRGKGATVRLVQCDTRCFGEYSERTPMRTELRRVYSTTGLGAGDMGFRDRVSTNAERSQTPNGYYGLWILLNVDTCWPRSRE